MRGNLFPNQPFPPEVTVPRCSNLLGSCFPCQLMIRDSSLSQYFCHLHISVFDGTVPNQILQFFPTLCNYGNVVDVNKGLNIHWFHSKLSFLHILVLLLHCLRIGSTGITKSNELRQSASFNYFSVANTFFSS